MQLGTADADRLALLGNHYNPNTHAFLNIAGVGPGDSVIDIGCGHGAVTSWLAKRVGDTGTVFALDASGAQLDIARQRLQHFSNVVYAEGTIENHPLGDVQAKWAYSRFLLMHVANPAKALAAMAQTLAPGGRVLLELADIGSLRFVPGSPVSDCWRNWWFELGKARGASYDIADHVEPLLEGAGLAVERKDRYQPISTCREAKLVHALGFEQCVPGYIDELGVALEDVQGHRDYLHAVLDDPNVAVELFQTTQYIARLR
jgi:ubiquinone/menaquinone biosynthesis C-methylase UbiE